MQVFDYIAEANLTLANNFHGHKVAYQELIGALEEAANAAQRLDRIKKALFYGRGDDIGPTRGVGVRLADAALYAMSGVKNVAEIGPGDQDTIAEAEIIVHGIIGKFTESGELIEALLKSIKTESPIDRVNVIEEQGDGFWYDAILFGVFGSNFGEAQTVNIAKLRKRFPNNFNEYDANNRDLDGERAILESGTVDPQASLDFQAERVEPLPERAVVDLAEKALAAADVFVPQEPIAILPVDTVGSDSRPRLKLQATDEDNAALEGQVASNGLTGGQGF